MEKVLFLEEQRHNQWWLWLILMASFGAIVIPFAYGIYVQEILHEPFGDNPMSTEGLIVTGLFSLLILVLAILLILKSRLITKITADGLYYSYPPVFGKIKKISPVEIESYHIKTYNSIFDFGGYGVKYRRKYGRIYMISGKTAMQIFLKNGKKLMLGTQKKQALQYAMEKLMNQENGG